MAEEFKGEICDLVQEEEDSIAIEREDDSISETLPEAVNILVLGRVGVGKARILNNIFQENLFETKAVTPVIRGVSQRQQSFIHHGLQFKIQIFDTLRCNNGSSRISMWKTMSAVRHHVLDSSPGVNLLLLVCKHGCHMREEVAKIKYILRHLNKDHVSLITTLVINGCNDLSNNDRMKLVAQMQSSSQTKYLCQFSLQGVIPVGFSDFYSVSESMLHKYHTVAFHDTRKLQGVVLTCHYHHVLPDRFLSSSSYCQELCLPSVMCLCFSPIYKCWRWGYTWDDFKVKD